MGPHCLSICKNRFEKFARIVSRGHKQMTFSDAGFLGVLSVNVKGLSIPFHVLTLVLLNPDIHCLCNQCRSRSVGF